VVFIEEISPAAIVRLVDTLTLFKIGYSWGGVTSLARPHFDLPPRSRQYDSRLVRYNDGLEAIADLLADLEGAFTTLCA
jgi:cystathionine beta-lyase